MLGVGRSVGRDDGRDVGRDVERKEGVGRGEDHTKLRKAPSLLDMTGHT